MFKTKKQQLSKIIEEDYNSGKPFTFTTYANNDSVPGLKLLNFLDYYVPEPVGYSDFDICSNLKGVSRFDGFVLDLVNYKFTRVGSQLFLYFGLDHRYRIVYNGDELFDYYLGYLDCLEEKGYRLEIKLNEGPYKIYNRILNDFTTLSNPLELVVNVIPLGVLSDSESESDLTSNRVTITMEQFTN